MSNTFKKNNTPCSNIMHYLIFYFHYYFTADNDLDGTIPKEVGLLTNLTDLELCE